MICLRGGPVGRRGTSGEGLGGGAGPGGPPSWWCKERPGRRGDRVCVPAANLAEMTLGDTTAGR